MTEPDPTGTAMAGAGQPEPESVSAPLSDSHSVAMGDSAADPGKTSPPAVQRISAAVDAVAVVNDVPLVEHAEHYQRAHAALQSELSDIAGV